MNRRPLSKTGREAHQLLSIQKHLVSEEDCNRTSGRSVASDASPLPCPAPCPVCTQEHSRPPESQLPPHGRTVTRCHAHTSALTLGHCAHLLISAQRDARSWLWRAAAFPGITCRKATHLPSGAFRRARKKQRNSGKENEARAAANTSPGEEPRGGGRKRPAGPGSSVAPARQEATQPRLTAARETSPTSDGVSHVRIHFKNSLSKLVTHVLSAWGR